MTTDLLTTDPVELRRALALIFSLHGIIEIRALRVERAFGRPVNVAGFFDAPEVAFKAVMGLPKCKACYWTLNSIPLDLLAIRANRLDVADDAGLTSDRHITRRVLLLIDCDPIRPHSEISATDAEHFAAQEVASELMGTMADDHGWPYGVLFDSGNGFGLWYRIDLPANDNGLIKQVLKAMAAKFSTPAVTIDTSVCNAARITKLPGSIARKGDHIAQRPHRVARIISQVDSFDEVDIVNESLLRSFAEAFAPPSATPAPRPAQVRTGGGGGGGKSAYDRCTAYLRKMPESVSGQHGHDALFAAAAACIRFGLNDGEALAALTIFNTTKSTPPWSEPEIRHKLADAAKAVDAAGDRGSMLRKSHQSIDRSALAMARALEVAHA